MCVTHHMNDRQKRVPGTTTRVSLPSDGPVIQRAGGECVVLLYGGSIGRKFDLPLGHSTIGRDPYASIVLEADSVSRTHARIEVTHTDSWIVDLGSTNGTFVNDVAVERHKLVSGDLLKIGDVIFKFLAGDNIEAAYHEEIYRMTISDGLTSVANVRYMNEFLDREFARSRRHGRDLSVLMVDIDHFKQVNDSLGHLTGDYVLRELAQLVHKRVRRDELFARYGGEEFVLVLPETDRQGAALYAEQLRQAIAAHEFVFDGARVPITVSIGIGEYDPDMAHPIDVIRQADGNLYEAKRRGRNQVVAGEPDIA